MDKFVIPARIVFNWDFTPYEISNFYKAFLKEIFHEPLFDVRVLNPQLFVTVPQLKRVRVLRRQLFYMKDYILTCKKKDSERLIPHELQTRWHLVDSPFYSLQDFVDTKDDKLFDFLLHILNLWVTHITSCEICKMKGSYCEFCRNNEILYPFQLSKTIVCKGCKALAHRICYKKESCPKCLRLKKRQEKRGSPSLSSSSPTITTTTTPSTEEETQDTPNRPPTPRFQ